MDEGSQTLPQPSARSTPDTHKWHKEPIVSPEVLVVKKPAEKRPKASNKEEECVEVPSKKNLQKKKRKKTEKTPKKNTSALRSGAHEIRRGNELCFYPERTEEERQP